MFDFYGMEADNDEIVLDPKETINDETAVDNGEAGSDMVTTDVSNISEKEAAHNEAASAGGVSTGDNQEQLEMDPVAATEAYVYKRFGLSCEDIDEANEQTVAEGAAIQEEVAAAAEEDPAVTTVTVVPPAGGETEVIPAVAPVVDAATIPEEEVEVIEDKQETASDVASLENLRHIMSREDDEPDTSATADVEFDVKTPNNDVNIQMEDKAITLEPNAEAEEPAAEEDGEEPAEPEGGEEPAAEEGGEEPEGGEESGESWAWF